MATVNFLYRSTKEKSNLSLRLLYRYNDNDFVYAGKTKLEVSKFYWTKQHKQKRVLDIDIINKQKEVNDELSNIENHILNAFDIVDTDLVNKEWLESQIDNYYNPKKKKNKIPNDLINYIERFIEFRKEKMSINTLKNYNVALRKFKRFQEFRNHLILIKDIDLNFINEFEKYCITEKYSHNTIARDIAFLKTVCNDAKDNDITTSKQLKKIKSKFKKQDNVYLTLEDLKAIESKSDLPEYLENAKDWLIISCQTGQRVSDFMRFSKEMIRYEKNKEGVLKPLIEFKQKKTNKLMTVPLSQKVIDILSKREGNFPRVITDQKYNDYIKKVAKLAELTENISGSKKIETKLKSKKYRKQKGTFEKWELVTSHIGRRTFATNNYGIIPTSFLIYITGHSTEAMFLNYIGKSNKDLAMELTNYF